MISYLKTFLIAISLVIAFDAVAARRGSPFEPHIDKRFDELESNSGEQPAVSKKYARAVFDVAVDGGTMEEHNLGVQLPAGAVVTDVYVYINTTFVDSGRGSVSLKCGGTRDLMGWQDMTRFSVGAILQGRYAGNASSGGQAIVDQTYTVAGASESTVESAVSACNITAEVRSDSGYVAQDAGKLTAIIEYFSF